MKLLLDTNRLSDALAEDEEVLHYLEVAQAVYVPVIVLGELRSGFLRGGRPAALVVRGAQLSVTSAGRARRRPPAAPRSCRGRAPR